MNEYKKAIEALQHEREVLIDKYGRETKLSQACKLAIQELKNGQKREELIDKLLKETKNLDRNSYRYREIYYAIDRLDECEVD